MCSIDASHRSSAGDDTPRSLRPNTRTEIVEQRFCVNVSAIEKRDILQYLDTLIIKIKLAFSVSKTAKKETITTFGSTLYDLSSGHRQKIALSDLDLSATAKQNDDRGVDFQLPAKSEAN